MASDGIWDKLTNEEVGEIVLNHSCVSKSDGGLATFSPNFKWTAQQICHQARYVHESTKFQVASSFINLTHFIPFTFYWIINRKAKSKDNLSVVIVDLKN